jgi:hypothetical protein
MPSFFSLFFAMILTLTFAGVTACSAGDRANSTLPSPAVDAPKATSAEQTAVVAGGCFWGIQAVNISKRFVLPFGVGVRRTGRREIGVADNPISNFEEKIPFSGETKLIVPKCKIKCVALGTRRALEGWSEWPRYVLCRLG